MTSLAHLVLLLAELELARDGAESLAKVHALKAEVQLAVLAARREIAETELFEAEAQRTLDRLDVDMSALEARIDAWASKKPQDAPVAGIRHMTPEPFQDVLQRVKTALGADGDFMPCRDVHTPGAAVAPEPPGVFRQDGHTRKDGE